MTLLVLKKVDIIVPFYRSREYTCLIKSEQWISDFSVKAEALSVYTPILRNGCNTYFY